MSYTRKDYLLDLDNPYLPHIKDKERFKDFYNELGRDPIQKTITYESIQIRMDFVVPRGKILELGCHWGHNIIQWAREGFECVGVDCSTTLLQIGEERISEELPGVQKRVTFINSMIEDFVPMEKYDTVVLTEVLEHVIDPVLILKKAEECLSEKGHLYVSSPSIRIGNASHVRGVTMEDLNSFVSKTNLGLEYWIEGIRYINLDGTTNPITIAVFKLGKK